MKRFKNILLVAGPDTDVTSSYKRALSLAKHNHARLMVLGVTDQLPDDLPRAVTTMAPSELQNIVVKEKLSQLEKLIKPARKKEGDAGQVISQLAHKKRVELLIMGTVARTGIPGFLNGNTAEEVLRKVNCSVLALKPKKFVSPVKRDK